MRHAVDLGEDVVKTDQRLIRGVHLATRQCAIVAGIMTFAQHTDTRVVAEGVESRDELHAIRDLGVTWGQGHLLGRPTPVAADAGRVTRFGDGASMHGASAF